MPQKFRNIFFIRENRYTFHVVDREKNLRISVFFLRCSWKLLFSHVQVIYEQKDRLAYVNPSKDQIGL